MSEQQFETYLNLLSQLLGLTAAQRDAIACELRDHLESRLEELAASGLSREDAITTALEEFGDAASLATRFRQIAQLKVRRRIMRTTFGLTGIAAMILAVAYLLPEQRPGVPAPSRVAAVQPSPSEPSILVLEEDEGHDEDFDAEQLLEQRRVTIAFQATPFEQVIEAFRKATGLNLFVNWPALEQAGLQRDKPITLHFTNLPVRQALELTLRQASSRPGSEEPGELAFDVSDSLVTISTRGEFARHLIVRTYDIGYLLHGVPKPPADVRSGGKHFGMHFGKPGNDAEPHKADEWAAEHRRLSGPDERGPRLRHHPPPPRVQDIEREARELERQAQRLLHDAERQQNLAQLQAERATREARLHAEQARIHLREELEKARDEDREKLQQAFEDVIHLDTEEARQRGEKILQEAQSQIEDSHEEAERLQNNAERLRARLGHGAGTSRRDDRRTPPSPPPDRDDRDLFHPGGQRPRVRPPNREETVDKILDLIYQTTDSEDWEPFGGDSTIAEFNDSLIVKTYAQNHHKIEVLIDKLYDALVDRTARELRDEHVMRLMKDANELRFSGEYEQALEVVEQAQLVAPDHPLAQAMRQVLTETIERREDMQEHEEQDGVDTDTDTDADDDVQRP